MARQPATEGRLSRRHGANRPTVPAEDRWPRSHFSRIPLRHFACSALKLLRELTATGVRKAPVKPV